MPKNKPITWRIEVADACGETKSIFVRDCSSQVRVVATFPGRQEDELLNLLVTAHRGNNEGIATREIWSHNHAIRRACRFVGDGRAKEVWGPMCAGSPTLSVLPEPDDEEEGPDPDEEEEDE